MSKARELIGTTRGHRGGEAMNSDRKCLFCDSEECHYAELAQDGAYVELACRKHRSDLAADAAERSLEPTDSLVSSEPLARSEFKPQEATP